jgi:hypothetical protein
MRRKYFFIAAPGVSIDLKSMKNSPWVIDDMVYLPYESISAIIQSVKDKISVSDFMENILNPLSDPKIYSSEKVDIILSDFEKILLHIPDDDVINGYIEQDEDVNIYTKAEYKRMLNAIILILKSIIKNSSDFKAGIDS